MSQLTIDTLLAQLTSYRSLHGNLPVVLRDADTQWAFKLKAEHLAIQPDDVGAGSRLQITAAYGDEMEIPGQDANSSIQA